MNKITLMGTIENFRQVDVGLFAFEMRFIEKRAPYSLLPKQEYFLYTVLCNIEQLVSGNANIEDPKLYVKVIGRPTVNLDKAICLGDIGVIAGQITAQKVSNPNNKSLEKYDILGLSNVIDKNRLPVMEFKQWPAEILEKLKSVGVHYLSSDTRLSFAIRLIEERRKGFKN